MSNNSNPLPTSPLSGGGEKPKFILYYKKLRDRAREFRKQPTDAERKIWEELLKNRDNTGYKFTRQKPLNHFIADFYCAKLLLILEIDGGVHETLTQRDSERTKILEEKCGIKIIRYTNDEVMKNFDQVIRDLKKKIIERKEFLDSCI